MSNIPKDIYERVHELSASIANASEAGDEPLRLSLYQKLRAYFDEQASLERSHPFLTEAVADHTDSPAEAAGFYELALQQARLFPDEPRHTKQIGLAEQLILLGRQEQAEAFLQDGRAGALRVRDDFWIHEADRLLHDLAA